MQKIRKGIETKIFVGSKILKTHARLIDKTAKDVRSRESGKRQGSRIWSPGVSLCSMSVEPECWEISGEQASGLPRLQLVKWCLNRAVVSVRKELRHLKICSLVQLQKSPWGGLQRAAVFLFNSWHVKEIAQSCCSRGLQQCFGQWFSLFS